MIKYFQIKKESEDNHMPFCTNCGAQAKEGAAFCTACGAKLTIPASPSPGPAPYQAPAPQGVYSAPPINLSRFSGITVRYCCPNGHAFDGNESVTQCPKCGAPVAKGGYIQMYRCGNYMGMAVGMGVYIDGVPYGHIGNKQSIRICVPFGSHMVHVTHTSTRSCNDPVFTVTPEAPYVWCKARFVKAGFKIEVEPSDPNDMPTA